ncbi:MAG TPA: Clp protease N-terminal domain-containing protein [Chloroflexia bacterium]|nr:Clp protease N-terminal domain-containing protein [Chloroflexia bacterium]
MPNRFEKFTDRARRVLVMAQEEAKTYNHNYIGTEHILLGLLREGHGVAALVLSSHRLETLKIRSAVEFYIAQGGINPKTEVARSRRVLELSIEEARKLNHLYIGTEHLLLGLLGEGQGIAAKVLISLGLDLEKVRRQVMQFLNQELIPEIEPDINSTSSGQNPGLSELPVQANLTNSPATNPPVTNSPITDPPITNSPFQARQTSGSDRVSLKEALVELERLGREKMMAVATQDFVQAENLREREQALFAQLLALANEQENKQSPISLHISEQPETEGLATLGVSLVEHAKAGDFDLLIGREREMERMLAVLNRRKDAHVLLVGETGTGKTAIVQEFALLIASAGLSGTDVIWVNHGQFVDLMSNPGRVSQILNRQKQPVILAIAHFDRLVEYASRDSRFSTLYDLLSHPNIRLICATTPHGYENIKEKEPELARRFQLIPINEPEDSVTLKILQGLKPRFEQHHSVSIEDAALEYAVMLSSKFLSGRAQPSRALNLLDDACSLVALRQTEQYRSTEPVRGQGNGRSSNGKGKLGEVNTHSAVTPRAIAETTASITGKSLKEIERI